MPTIEEYHFGHIVIDGQEHTKDVIILPDRVVPNWWRKDGHGLVIEDFGAVLTELPEHLVVGCGAHSRMTPDSSALKELRERGITVEILPTEKAVARYGELDSATTAAALHLTC